MAIERQQAKSIEEHIPAGYSLYNCWIGSDQEITIDRPVHEIVVKIPPNAKAHRYTFNGGPWRGYEVEVIKTSGEDNNLLGKTVIVYLK